MVSIVGKDQTVVKRVTCRNCSSILEYVQAEVKKYRGTDYTGGADGQDWIDCPQCQEKVILRSW